jgi:hypothetical protein
VSSWDRRSERELARSRDAAIARQMADVVGIGSPFWVDRLAALELTASAITNAAQLARLPALTERDVSPQGDPAQFASLVVQPPQRWAAHADGPVLRRALTRRLRNRDGYRRVVETDTRPTSFLEAGLTMDYLLACTRGDLDLMARAGARALSVLGIGPADTMAIAVPPAATVEYRGLALAALAAGVPALTPGGDPAAVAAWLAVAPVSVLAAPAAELAGLLDALTGTDLSALRLAVAVGAPSAADRLAAEQALADAGAAPGARVLAVHAPNGARVLWAECPQAPADQAALHTYPDLEVVQLCDPETGEDYRGDGPGEPVLTQLGFRGSALVRWRTGDLAGGPVLDAACPGCARTVPRLASGGLAAGGLAAGVAEGRLDLRAVAGLLSGWPGLADWAIAVGRRARDGAGRITVHLGASADPGELVGQLAPALEQAAGVLPSQIVAVPAARFTRPEGDALTPRIVLEAPAAAARLG